MSSYFNGAGFAAILDVNCYHKFVFPSLMTNPISLFATSRTEKFLSLVFKPANGNYVISIGHKLDRRLEYGDSCLFV